MSEKVVKPLIEDRIYVGNVDYKATEDELKELFKDLKVTEVEIPFKETTRGDKTFKRHLGFAFVQFETKDDADKAVSEFNHQKFQRRNIFIKKAVPPPTEDEKKERIEAYKAKKEKAEQEKKAKAEKSPPTQPEGTASLDTIFITNLDYKVNVKALNAIFKEYKPKWIHVPSRRPSKVGGKFRRPFNKGIAFVKFSSEELQKKAVEEFNGKEINGREIVVDVAIDSRIPNEQQQEEEEGEEEK